MSNFCEKCGCHFATHNDDGSCVRDEPEDGCWPIPCVDHSVDLIASGYEWVCPLCENFNREIQVTGQVYCPECHRQFIVTDYNHAVGG